MPISGEFDKFFSIAVAVLAGGWLLRCGIGGLLYLLGAVPGSLGRTCRQASEWVTPALMRRGVSALVGAAILGGGGIAVAAQAAPTMPAPQAPRTLPSDTGISHRAVEIPDLDRGSLSDSEQQPSGSAKQPTRTASGQQPGRSVRVRPGDTLWDIAASQLVADTGSKTPTEAQIDRQWRRWYRQNEAAIGSDPGLIRAGTRLTPPTSGGDR